MSDETTLRHGLCNVAHAGIDYRTNRPAAAKELPMLLDIAVIDEVRETLGDDTYRAFAARMLAEVAQTDGTLRDLLAAGDLGTLAGAAHRTSGSCAGIGAKGLHALLKDIENTARGGAVTALPDLLAALAPRMADTRSALAALVGPV